MSQTHTPAVPALVLRRRYKFSRERIFEAWTNPEIAAKFLGPEDVKVPEIELHPANGGTYRIVMLLPDGQRMVAKGVYREVRPPERLCMTWVWEEDDPALEHQTLLTLDFQDADGETELVLTQEQLASEESRVRHEHGWTAVLDQLAKAL